MTEFSKRNMDIVVGTLGDIVSSDIYADITPDDIILTASMQPNHDPRNGVLHGLTKEAADRFVAACNVLYSGE